MRARDRAGRRRWIGVALSRTATPRYSHGSPAGASRACARKTRLQPRARVREAPAPDRRPEDASRRASPQVLAHRSITAAACRPRSTIAHRRPRSRPPTAAQAVAPACRSLRARPPAGGAPPRLARCLRSPRHAKAVRAELAMASAGQGANEATGCNPVLPEPVNHDPTPKAGAPASASRRPAMGPPCVGRSAQTP